MSVFGGSPRVVLERIGVQPIAPQKLISRSMYGVGAALQNRVHHAARGLPVLRVVGVGLNLKLLHRIDRRDVRDVVAARPRIVRYAIDQECRRLRSSSYAPLRNRTGVEGPLIGERTVVIPSRPHTATHQAIPPAHTPSVPVLS